MNYKPTNDDIRNISNLMGFFASAIRCGSDWDEHCEEALKKGRESLSKFEYYIGVKKAVDIHVVPELIQDIKAIAGNSPVELLFNIIKKEVEDKTYTDGMNKYHVNLIGDDYFLRHDPIVTAVTAILYMMDRTMYINGFECGKLANIILNEEKK